MAEATLWEPVRAFSRALVVVAHPDDAEFGGAGTIARWVSMGTDVRYFVVTDGASGSSDEAMTRDRLRVLREAEQREACRRLGVSSVEFGGYEDGYLTASIDARRTIAAAIRRHRPEAVISLNPEVRWAPWGYVNHPDHRAAGDLVLHAINPAASTRLWDLSLIEEGLEPWDVSELWMMSFGGGPDVVDIGDTFDKKIQALRAHASQLGDWDPEPRMRQAAADIGARVDVAMAEGFTVLRFRELEETPAP